jgi:hypothetical protein
MLALASEWPSLIAHRAADRAGRRRVLGAARAAAPALTLARLRRIFSVESGKI